MGISRRPTFIKKISSDKNEDLDNLEPEAFNHQLSQEEIQKPKVKLEPKLQPKLKQRPKQEPEKQFSSETGKNMYELIKKRNLLK